MLRSLAINKIFLEAQLIFQKDYIPGVPILSIVSGLIMVVVAVGLVVVLE